MAGSSTVAATGSALTSGTRPDNTDFVFYLDANQHLNVLQWDGNAWTNQDVTVASGATNIVAAGSSLASIAKANGTVHAFYLGGDQHVYQIFWTTSRWVNQDLTATVVNNSALAASGSSLASSTRSDNTDYVSYLDVNQHLNMLIWDGSTWTNKDITVASSALNTATAGSSLTSVAKTNGTLHVFYLGTDHHVYQIFGIGTNWSTEDVTASSQTTVAAGSGTALTSVTGPDNSDYVVYLGGNQHVNMLLWDGAAWNNFDLSAQSNATNISMFQSPMVTILGDPTF